MSMSSSSAPRTFGARTCAKRGVPLQQAGIVQHASAVNHATQGGPRRRMRSSIARTASASVISSARNDRCPLRARSASIVGLFVGHAAAADEHQLAGAAFGEPPGDHQPEASQSPVIK